MARWLQALLVFALLGAAAPAAAQVPTLRVLGGEHGDFTRIVLQGAASFEWSLTPDTRRQLLQITPRPTQIDLSRAFDRIPRSRLAAIEPTEGGLWLMLACDCPLRAFSDRPGVLVVDVLDPPRDSNNGRRESGNPAPGENPANDIARASAGADADAQVASTAPAAPDIGRRAGAALAQRWPAGATGPPPGTGPGRLADLAGPGLAEADPAKADTPAAAASLVNRQALRGTLRDALARAVAAGYLSGEEELLAEIDLIEAGQEAPEGTAQLRITPPSPNDAPATGTAAMSWSTVPPPETSTDPHCRDLDTLDFLARPDPPDFNAGLADLSARLYGEFDRPDQAARAELIRHYLSAGMGAEARLLIDNARHPVAGSALLRGLADILDDRPSNARHKLAGLLGCPGPAGMLAALAGPPPRDLADHADAIALAFGNAPPALRRLFGPVLTERLSEAGAIEAARVVAARLHLTGPAGTIAPALPEALLERARGAPGRAAANLAAQHDGADAGAMLRRLQFMLEAGDKATPKLIEQAEAMAASARHGQKGIDLMAVAIRHDIARGAHAPGFARLDRLERWIRPHRADRQLLTELSDSLWTDAAASADETRFLALILARGDWRAGERSPGARSVLATRLLDLGFADTAATLVTPPGDDHQRRLLARAMLARDRADEAVALLAPMIGDAPTGADRQTGLQMARALRAAGATDAALAAFSELGALDEAARTAIARRDWPALARLTADAQTDAASPVPDRPAADTDTGAQAEPMEARAAPGAAAVPAPAAIPAIEMLQQLGRVLGSEPQTVMDLTHRLPAAQHQDEALAEPDAAGNGVAGQAGPPAPAFAGSADQGLAVGAANARADAALWRGPDDPGGTLMLRRNAALLDQSAALRDAIGALLQVDPP